MNTFYRQKYVFSLDPHFRHVCPSLILSDLRLPSYSVLGWLGRNKFAAKVALQRQNVVNWIPNWKLFMSQTLFEDPNHGDVEGYIIFWRLLLILPVFFKFYVNFAAEKR